ncbi:hypothetical protein [Methanogenium sp. MK-MG]|uniref:hypothetical protein n=1 Tax=Methanogenium sp. MK-MG TaxID=2599926 RepID=UPI0013EA7C1D|nr:hypothetical protein [Methanogenium sp. MK-MG]KAF1075960.1 hypothetical protein MKMG_01590 [Methanogenium sp. MK-MG]
MIPAMLPAYVTESGGWKVWCPYCGCLHGHGAEPGYRIPPCGYGSSPYHQLPKGYFLLPTGEPLPAEANRLHRRGVDTQLRRMRSGKVKPYSPPPVPDWGKPITDRSIAEGLMIEWSYQSGESLEEREWTQSNFKRAWECFADYNDQLEKIRAMNIDPDVFSDYLQDILLQ